MCPRTGHERIAACVHTATQHNRTDVCPRRWRAVPLGRGLSSSLLPGNNVIARLPMHCHAWKKPKKTKKRATRKKRSKSHGTSESAHTRAPPPPGAPKIVVQFFALNFHSVWSRGHFGFSSPSLDTRRGVAAITVSKLDRPPRPGWRRS